MTAPLTDEQALAAFGQGESCARKGGYLSDNPHPYQSEAWRIWREGFAASRRDNPTWWEREGLSAPCPNWRDGTRRCNCKDCRARRAKGVA